MLGNGGGSQAPALLQPPAPQRSLQLLTSSMAKCVSSGPYPKKALEYLPSGMSRYRNSFMPKLHARRGHQSGGGSRARAPVSATSCEVLHR